MNDMRIARAANVMEFQCGCKYEFQLIGYYVNIPSPHIIPCFPHADLMQRGKITLQDIENFCEAEWERITSEVRTP